MLGLELMVAADVVRTVTFEPTVRNVAVLALLVLVRTLLSWGMSVEIKGAGRGKSELEAALHRRHVESPHSQGQY